MITKQRILKKGLLIGINYKNSDYELNGCINDTENLYKFLIKRKYFNKTDLTFMNDNTGNLLYPTKANIMKQFDNLINFALTNKNTKIYLFVAYSGHGTSVRDLNGDEKSSLDSAICPVDFINNGFIIDDYIKSNFVDKLPANVSLFMMFDSCHSGTVCDLKYNYTCDNKNTCIKDSNKETKCKVVMISGCKDDQTSADTYLPDPETRKYEYQGAMTASFLMNYADKITTNGLIKKMRQWLLANQYTQIPQVSSGGTLNINEQFILEQFRQ